MKRLIKKSKHDLPNRDYAILYINNKFYQDSTHAMCLYQFLKETNNTDFDLDSLLNRPYQSDLEELSKSYDIVLGHLVEKENGVFIIYGFINGRMVEYDNIPDDILQKISNNYNMPCYNDLDNEEMIDNGYDKHENSEKYKNRKKELENEIYEEGIQILTDLSFTKQNDYYISKDKNMVAKYYQDNTFSCYKFGDDIENIAINELNNYFLEGSEYIHLLDNYSPIYSCDKFNSDDDIEMFADLTLNNNLQIQLITYVDSFNIKIQINDINLNEEQLVALDSYLWEKSNKNSQISDLNYNDFHLLEEFDINNYQQYLKSSDINNLNLDDFNLDNFNLNNFNISSNINNKKIRLIKKGD